MAVYLKINTLMMMMMLLLLFMTTISFFPCSSMALQKLILSSSPSQSQPNRPLIFKRIYAFGDSYTDTGNTESSTGPSFFTHVSNPPYGQTFFHRPTNRYSDGRLVVDFLSEALSLPYLPPYLDTKADLSYGVNFAVAGATAIKHRFFVRNNLTFNVTPQSLQTELKWFNDFLERKGCNNYISYNNKGFPPPPPHHHHQEEECNEIFNNSLFWIGEMGANDYSYTFGSSVSEKTIRDLSIASVTAFLKVLLNKGAKYVVVQGLPPTGCLPVFMYFAFDEDERDEMGCIAALNKRSYQHNQVLQSKLIEMNKKEFPGAVIVYADYWNSYSSVVKNPSKYGIKEKFRACCGSGGGLYNFDIFNTCGSPSSSIPCKNAAEYINWDGGHLTEAMNRILTHSFLNGTFTTPPFDYLIQMKLKAG